MTFDEIEAEISLLLTEMQNEPSDRHELYQRLREAISSMRAMGMPVPNDLIDLERALESAFNRDRTLDGTKS
ncbi:MAG: hypothetical protein R3D33_09960 [Hyphomicrobiaceae bacterium]